MKIHQWQKDKKGFTLVDDTLAKKSVIKYIKNGDFVLDIGCGDCVFFDLIKNSRKDCQLYGFDIVEDALKICKSKGYNSLNSLNNVKLKFNVITLFECFEHMDYKQRFNQVELINKLLKNKGYVILSFPNIMSFLSVLHYGDNPEHREPYPSERNIVKFFQGYEIIAKKYFNPWLNPLKVLHCLLAGLSFKAIYNNVCYILRKK